MTNPQPAIDNTAFPILDRLVFLNHAGVAPISGPAAQALQVYANQAAQQAYHQSGWYAQVKQLKTSAAQLIHAPGPHTIAIIPNTSTGLNLVAGGLDWLPGDNVVITAIEYPANRYPWEALKRKGVELVEVEPDEQGQLHVQDIANAITNRTRVVSVSHVQYSTGQRLNLKPISDMAHQAGAYLCVDAIQSVGVLPVDVMAMGIDFLAADGHKWMLGPEGCGVFYAKEDLIQCLYPAVVGWMCMVDCAHYGDYRFEFAPDARRFEPGSYNIPGIVALQASLRLLLEVGIETIWTRVQRLTQQLCVGLQKKGYRVISSQQSGDRSGIIVFEPDEKSGTAMQIVKQLEKQDIIIVLREGRLRASPHFYNTPKQIDTLLEAMP